MSEDLVYHKRVKASILVSYHHSCMSSHYCMATRRFTLALGHANMAVGLTS